MVFSEGVFLFLFLPITILVYFSPVCKRIETKNFWLLFVSIGFYAWGEPVYVFLMLASICVNWLLGRLVAGCPRTSRGKRIVAAACVYNLGVLFIFKYLDWLLGGNSALSGLALPIGISFYTFQALSYVIDVYRGKEQAQKSILDVGLYIAFFPQLIAGPIVRYGTVSQQIRGRTHSFQQFSDGVWRFIIGLSKKLLIANQVGVVAKIAFRQQGNELSVVLAWAGALAAMLQIYFDFSGYSDMAIGLGKMFGFEFLENFNYPYISCSVAEYWRRWHISLSEWFRDYLYYPLSLGPAIRLRKAAAKRIGRKKAGMLSTTFPLFVVWMATGLWHGANSTFIAWGLIYFVLIFWEQHRKPMKNRTLGTILGFSSTFLITLIMKVIFNAKSLSHVLSYYASMLHLNGNTWADAYGLYWIRNYRMFLLLGIIFSFPVLERLGRLFQKTRAKNIWYAAQTVAVALLLMLDICYAIGSNYNPFIYFNF